MVSKKLICFQSENKLVFHISENGSKIVSKKNASNIDIFNIFLLGNYLYKTEIFVYRKTLDKFMHIS